MLDGLVVCSLSFFLCLKATKRGLDFRTAINVWSSRYIFGLRTKKFRSTGKGTEVTNQA